MSEVQVRPLNWSSTTSHVQSLRYSETYSVDEIFRRNSIAAPSDGVGGILTRLITELEWADHQCIAMREQNESSIDLG